jgi:hypothetical protein
MNGRLTALGLMVASLALLAVIISGCMGPQELIGIAGLTHNLKAMEAPDHVPAKNPF